MENDKLLRDLVYLYDKYGVKKDLIMQMDDLSLKKGVKGIIAELDTNKNREFTEADIELIKTIYGQWC